ncbi:MAG: hypothetical protein J5999_07460 [Oscillospiraceae bacterium]|nr:hypothetical protein [Oscillospiraceae bacterium]
MKIASEVLTKLLSKKDICVELICNEDININEEMSYMLTQIRNVIIDTSNNDYMCIEKIIEIFEKYGIDCGERHD